MAMRPSTPGQGTLTCKKVKGKLVRMVPSGGGSSGSASAASCKPPKGLGHVIGVNRNVAVAVAVKLTQGRRECGGFEA